MNGRSSKLSAKAAAWQTLQDAIGAILPDWSDDVPGRRLVEAGILGASDAFIYERIRRAGRSYAPSSIAALEDHACELRRLLTVVDSAAACGELAASPNILAAS